MLGQGLDDWADAPLRLHETQIRRLHTGARVLSKPLRGSNSEERIMSGEEKKVTVALFVRLEANPGKEADGESFLLNGLSIVQDEPSTTTWYALKLGPSTFGVFDTFSDDTGRQAHL